jgi:hypothetical protein
LTEPDAGEPMELVMPFVVCWSNGGPYMDDAFAAGWQAGEIAASVALAERLNVHSLHWPIFRTALTKQIDLVALRHNGVAHVVPSDGYPEWGALTITFGGVNDAT